MDVLVTPEKSGNSPLLEWNSSNINAAPAGCGAYLFWDVFDTVIYAGNSGDMGLKNKLKAHLRDKDIPGLSSFEWFKADTKEEAGLLARILTDRHNPIYNNPGFDSESLKKRVND